MTDGTVGEEDLFSAIGLREFLRLRATRSGRSGFQGTGRATERVETIATEISRIAPEIGAAEENGKPIDRDQPE